MTLPQFELLLEDFKWASYDYINSEYRDPEGEFFESRQRLIDAFIEGLHEPS